MSEKSEIPQDLTTNDQIIQKQINDLEADFKEVTGVGFTNNKCPIPADMADEYCLLVIALNNKYGNGSDGPLHIWDEHVNLRTEFFVEARS